MDIEEKIRSDTRHDTMIAMSRNMIDGTYYNHLMEMHRNQVNIAFSFSFTQFVKDSNFDKANLIVENMHYVENGMENLLLHSIIMFCTETEEQIDYLFSLFGQSFKDSLMSYAKSGNSCMNKDIMIPRLSNYFGVSEEQIRTDYFK